MIKRSLALGLVGGVIASCSGDSSSDVITHDGQEIPVSQIYLLQDEATIDAYVNTYADKDLQSYLSLFTDDVLTVLYPDSVFGSDKASITPAVKSDFETRLNASLTLSDRFHIGDDQWIAFGQTLDGEQVAPIWVLFDLTDDKTKIEATYTHIGTPFFLTVPSVPEPTPGMVENTHMLMNDLRAGSLEHANMVFAPEVELFSYPPANISNYGPVRTGPADVASVLNFKWGEGAFRRNNVPRQDTYISKHMQFLIVGISGDAPGADRVAFMTFNADPQAQNFEKIIRVDVMGPSGSLKIPSGG